MHGREHKQRLLGVFQGYSGPNLGLFLACYPLLHIHATETSIHNKASV